MEAVPKSFSFFPFMHPKPTIIILSYSFPLFITNQNSFLFNLAFQETFLSHFSPFKCNSRNIYFCFIDYIKAFDSVALKKLWEILQEVGIQNTLPASWEIRMQVKKQQLELDTEQQTGSKSGKEYVKAIILSPCLFNLHAEDIMRNARLDEAQAGIKIAGRNINNLRYADDTTL